MKVLVLTNLYPPDVSGGYELGCKQAVDALHARGHDVLVLTSVPRMPVEGVAHVQRSFKLTDLWDDSHPMRRSQVTEDMAWAEGMLINAFNVHCLLAALHSFQPDIVYVWMLVGLGGLGLMRCLQMIEVPWVWHLMDDVPLVLCMPTPRGRHRGLLRAFERGMKGSYLACSRRLVAEITKGGINLENQVQLVPNWIVGERPAERGTYYRGGALRIVAAGQVAKHKGMDLLIQSARHLSDWGYGDFHIDIFGRAASPLFATMIECLGVGARVSLRGSLAQSELVSRFGEYDLFAFPTWEREPFAFAPLEAASRGCVPVISRLCGNSEWVVHNAHAIKVPRTAEAFARTFAQVMDGAIELEPIGRRAAAMVWRDFHLKSIIVEIERALASAATRPRSYRASPDRVYQMALRAERRTLAAVHNQQRA